MKTRLVTRTLVLVALVLDLGVAGVSAQHKPAKMTWTETIGNRNNFPDAAAAVCNV